MVGANLTISFTLVYHVQFKIDETG